MASPRKSTAEDFECKKEFVERQQELKRYIDNVERLALIDIIRDPLVVHSLEDYAEAYREQDNLRQIRSILKSLFKIKKKNVDILPVLKSMASEGQPALDTAGNARKMKISQTAYEKKSIFKLNTPAEAPVFSKETAMAAFRDDVRRACSMPRMSIQQPTFTRSLSVSSSHGHLIKKMEKTESPGLKNVPQTRVTSEITTATSFRNGVLKSMNPAERSPLSVQAADGSRTASVTGVKIQQLIHPQHFSAQRAGEPEKRGSSPTASQRRPSSESPESAER